MRHLFFLKEFLRGMGTSILLSGIWLGSIWGILPLIGVITICFLTNHFLMDEFIHHIFMQHIFMAVLWIFGEVFPVDQTQFLKDKDVLTWSVVCCKTPALTIMFLRVNFILPRSWMSSDLKLSTAGLSFEDQFSIKVPDIIRSRINTSKTLTYKFVAVVPPL